MDTTRANTSAVVIALLLAALLAGSLVTFSILAGGADDPGTGAVSVARLDPETEPVVLDSPEVLGARFEPALQAPEQIPPPAAITAADRIEAIVLGTRFWNQDDKRKPGSKSAPTRSPTETTNPGKDDGPKGGSKDTSKCPCGKSKKKDNTPKGHAYGYHKDPGTTGLKRGHDKARGNSGSNRNGSGSGNANPSKSSGHGNGKGNSKGKGRN